MIKTIYCELEFLREFVRDIPQPDLLGDDEKYLSWKKIYQLLKNNLVIFDKLISVEELKELKIKKDIDSASNVMWSIIRDNTDLSNSFHLLRASNYDQLTNHQLQSIYLMILNQRKRQEIAQSTGIIVLGKSEIEKYNSMFAERSVNLEAGTDKYKNWSDIDYPEAIKTSNSLIIVDNYILKDTKKYERNIYSLLDVILPFQTSVEYNISICVELNGMSESFMQSRYDHVNSKIHELRPYLNYTLEILDACGRFHDRKLITNNIYIRSGEGFDIFPIKKSTDIDIVFPFMYNTKYKNNKESYNTLIEELKSIDYSCIYGKHIWKESNSENRLLSNIDSRQRQ